MDWVLGTARHSGTLPLVFGRHSSGVADRVWHPLNPGSLMQRLVRLRDSLDQVQGHSPGLFLERSRQRITEAVIEAERTGSRPIPSTAATEEAIRRIVILVQRAQDDFVEALDEPLR